MLPFSDSCRVKACNNVSEKKNELIRKFNNLLTIRQLATTSTKRPGDSYATIPRQMSSLFKFQLKIVLDQLAVIFPSHTSQFLDLLFKYQAWAENSSTNLHVLSKTCDHIEHFVEISENLAKLDTINFDSFLETGELHVSEPADQEKAQ